MPKNVFRVVTWGGLGDGLMITPSLKALKASHPTSKLIVYCTSDAHRQILRHNPHIDSLRAITDRSALLDRLAFRYKWRRFIFTNYGWFGVTKLYQKHATEIIADYFDLTLTDTRPEVFLTEAETAKAQHLLAGFTNPVVINPTSRSSANQQWPYQRWEAVIEALPPYTFLQLGLPDEYALKGAVDLRGKVSLREAMAVVKYSRGVVGVDSFYSHVAQAVHKPAVTLFGPSNPEIWGYAGQVNIDKKVACAPCIDELANEPCPYQRLCMQQITTQEVIAAIEAHITADPVPADLILHP